jgi:serine/threonine protein kinase
VSDALVPGLKVGRYQLLFRLGKGGMGEVWAASQNEAAFGFQKLIAIKVLRTKEFTSNAALMFFDEAKAASALQHQAIVPTVDLGQDGDILYIAMDLVRGPSLTALLQRLVINKQTMSPALVAYIGAQVASALDYAHERATFEGQAIRLIHRDISPHNMLLDLNGAVRLMDFGVARTAIQEHMSTVGTVRGKPSYMAPEQVVGGDIDARTDLFSLGIVLYECSCLKRLFGRSNPVKSMDAVLHHTPKPLIDLVPGFPEPLWRVIEKALSKKPDDRYQRAADFAEALNAASRTLEGASMSPRSLCTLIDGNFPKDAFDLDGRVKEALASVKETADGEKPSPLLGESDAPEVVETKLEPSNKSNPRVPAVVVTGFSGTRIVSWPSAHAPDPLAPEAIEEARTTMFAAGTPSGLQLMNMTSAPSLEGITPFHGNTGQTFAYAQKRKQNLTLILVVSIAAVLLLGAAVAMQFGGRTSEGQAQLIVTDANAPTVVPLPGVAAGAHANAKESPAGQAEAVDGETAHAHEGARKTKTPQPSHAQPQHKEEPEPAHTEHAIAPPSEPRKATPSTAQMKKEVHQLISQIKEHDSKKASTMLVTLSELSGDDTDPHYREVLSGLRSEAKQILAGYK